MLASDIICDIVIVLGAIVMADKRILKLVGEVLKNQKNVSFDDLSRILEEFGYEKRQSGSGGSHYTFRKTRCNPISVPKKKPVNKQYVKEVIALLGLEEWYEENN